MKLSFSNVGLLSLLTISSVSLMSNEAIAQRHSNSTKVVAHRVESTLYAGQSISLHRAFADKLVQGEQITSLRIVASSSGRSSRIMLKQWGSIIDSTSASGSSRSGQSSLNVPGHMSLNDLRIAVSDATYISRVVATVEQVYVDPYSGGGGYGNGYDNDSSDIELIKAQVNQHAYGITKLPVRSMIQQMSGVNLNGKEVVKVVVKASSTGYGYQSASVQLEINGRRVGQPQQLSSRLQNIAMTLSPYQRNIIGEDIQDIKVVVVGDALVKMVGVKAKEEHYDNGSGYDNTPNYVEIITQKALFGKQRSILSDLVGYNQSVSFTKTISSIELVVNGQGSIQLAGAGYGKNQARRNGAQSRSLVFNLTDGATTVKDLALVSEGSLTVEKIKITFNPMY